MRAYKSETHIKDGFTKILNSWFHEVENDYLVAKLTQGEERAHHWTNTPRYEKHNNKGRKGKGT